MCGSVLQCVAVCCSVLQCVAVGKFDNPETHLYALLHTQEGQKEKKKNM